MSDHRFRDHRSIMVGSLRRWEAPVHSSGACTVLSLVTGVCSIACLHLGRAESRALEGWNLPNGFPKQPISSTRPQVSKASHPPKQSHQLGTACSHVNPTTSKQNHQLGTTWSHADPTTSKKKSRQLGTTWSHANPTTSNT